MKTLFSILFLSLSFLSLAQGPTFEWAKGFGGANNDLGSDLAVDAYGNVYTTGQFQGTVDFDPGSGTFNLTSTGSFDVFVQKMDASGNFLWAKSFGGIGQDISTSLVLDTSGNVYTTGQFVETVDFDPNTGVSNLTSVGSSDIFIQKMDASGNFLWAKSFGGSNNDDSRSITIDDYGNIYTTGVFSGTADFDPGLGTVNSTSAGSLDVFVHKLHASGDFLWVKTFGGTGSDEGNSIAIDLSGNVYTTGYFRETVDFDPGPATTNVTSAGAQDFFMQKMDSSGNFLWARSFGGTSSEIGLSLEIDASGNAYSTGFFLGMADFDPGPGTTILTPVGSYDVFIHKMDSSGNFLWAKSFGGADSDFGRALDVDIFGNVYTTGNFSGTVDFDPGTGTSSHTSLAFTDVFVQKLDSLGNFIWAKSFGGNGNGFSIHLDTFTNIYTTGRFSGTADFNPNAGTLNLNSVGGYDVFIQKMSQCVPNFGTDIQTACNSFTWIDGNTYTSSNNTASWTLINSAGCDSVVALDLTISNSNTGTDVITACDSYTWIDGNTYTSSNNTATWTLTNSAGCDSVITLDLTINSVSDNTTSISGITITSNNTNADYAWMDCDNNYALVTGETDQSFTPVSNGSYAVEITENGCVDTTACTNITTVGIIESSFNEDFIVYPNPTNGMFSIGFNSTQANINLRIINTSGELIGEKTYQQVDKIKYELNEQNGVYLIELSDGKGQHSIIRLIKL